MVVQYVPKWEALHDRQLEAFLKIEKTEKAKCCSNFSDVIKWLYEK